MKRSMATLALLLLLWGCTPTPTPLPTFVPTLPALPSPTFTATPTQTPTPAPSPTFTPFPTPEPVALVKVKSLALRSGPDALYPIVAGLKYQQKVKVMGRDERGFWLKVVTEEGLEGWAAASYLDFPGPIEAIPVAEVPPLPPSPTPTATPIPPFTGKLVFQLSSGGDIYILNLTTMELKRITAGMDPSFSPDGKRIAFARWEGDRKGIWVLDLENFQEWPVFIHPHAKSPDWSPDGDKIVFTRQHGGKPEETRCYMGRCFTIPADPFWKLGVVEPATGRFHELPCDDHSFSPSWSPDGRLIAYDGDTGIVVVSADGTRAYKLTDDPDDTYPVWSPDGTRLAFMHHQHDHWEIYTVNADGTRRTRLTAPGLLEKPYNSVAPAWSPDGKFIVFLTDRNGKWEVYVMKSDGSGQKPLLPEVLGSLEFRYDFVSEHVLDWWGPRASER
ncbi:MAG: SH3 domain-containing protein [Anaerolineae bacterium]|nr:SH3 domain-containing protein [Anaerolineae bacterium]MDW8101486.1 SH3 domain-containing protein [Anaerolineae bacterium]